MILLSIICSSFLINDNMILFNFHNNSDLSNWRIVNDVVMGGRSKASFSTNFEGHAVFEGSVSLENNGGFASVRYQFPKKKIEEYDTFVFRLRGDGKKYQFRVKRSRSDRHSYVYEFQSTNDWQILEIPMLKMKPQFRGRKLAMPNFSGEEMEELAILVGNKKVESFKLELDNISLK